MAAPSTWRSRASRSSEVPRADLQHPLSRLYESEFYTHFGYPPYWDAPPTWGVAPATPEPQPGSTMADTRGQTAAELGLGEPVVASAADSHVRSWREVKGYHINAADGEIGHVDNLLFDEKSWLIRFIEVDTSNWIGGTSVLVPRTGARVRELARQHLVGGAHARAGEAQPSGRRSAPDRGSGGGAGGILRREGTIGESGDLLSW